MRTDFRGPSASAPRTATDRLQRAEFAGRWEDASEMGVVKKYRRKGRTYYKIRLSIQGERVEIYNHKGVKFASRAHADSVLHQVQGKLAEARDQMAAVAEFLAPRSKPNLVVSKLREYLVDLEDRVALGQLSPHTIANVRRWILPPDEPEEPVEGDQAPAKPGRRSSTRKSRPGPRRRAGSDYFGWWAGVSIHELRARHIVGFRRHLEEQGLGPESVRSMLEAFRAFLIWCKGQELIDRVPEVKVPERVKRRPALLLGRRRARVLEAIAWEERGVFLLMALGVRPGAARAAAVEDVDSDGYIKIHRAVKSHKADGPVGATKAKRENWVPLTRELAAWIREFAVDRHPTARLFYNPRAALSRNPGRRWTHRALWLEWRQACERAGVPYVPLYQGTKHSFATERLLKGKSKDAVAEFMQISPHQIDTYAQWARELSAEVLDDDELADETRAALTDLREWRKDGEGGNGGGTPS